MVIFTDGAQTQRPDIPYEKRIKPGDNTQKLKDKNVTVFSVGAGSPDPIELWSMATGPGQVIRARLENLGAAVNRIVGELCKIEITVSVL